MKKTYQSPVITFMTVRVSHLMDPSPVGLSSTQATVDETSGEYKTLSRRSSLWDDDEEE